MKCIARLWLWMLYNWLERRRRRDTETHCLTWHGKTFFLLSSAMSRCRAKMMHKLLKTFNSEFDLIMIHKLRSLWLFFVLENRSSPKKPVYRSKSESYQLSNHIIDPYFVMQTTDIVFMCDTFVEATHLKWNLRIPIINEAQKFGNWKVNISLWMKLWRLTTSYNPDTSRNLRLQSLISPSTSRQFFIHTPGFVEESLSLAPSCRSCFLFCLFTLCRGFQQSRWCYRRKEFIVT